MPKRHYQLQFILLRLLICRIKNKERIKNMPTLNDENMKENHLVTCLGLADNSEILVLKHFQISEFYFFTIRRLISFSFLFTNTILEI